jgi:hypothetical protein
MSLLEVDNWERDNGYESAYTNNMVGREVEAYTKGNYVVLLRRTKISKGWSMEVRDGLEYLIHYQDGLSEEDISDEFKGAIEKIE